MVDNDLGADSHLFRPEVLPHPFRGGLLRYADSVGLNEVIARLETLLPKTTSIHVFPAMPASLAVAFGMAIKPKVSFPIQVYDAEGPNGVFHPALSLPLLSSS